MLLAQDFLLSDGEGGVGVRAGVCFSGFLPLFPFLPCTLPLRTIQGVFLLIHGGRGSI